MSAFETRNNHRTYDADTHKVVRKDAVVLDPASFDVSETVRGLREEGWQWLADQLERQIPKPPRIPEPFPLGAHVRLNPETTVERHGWSGVWKERADEGHLAIVIQHLAQGDVRVWDTVECDWWSCGAEHLAYIEDES